MVYVAPVPSDAPPVRAAYHLIVPAPVAPRITVPASQRAAGVVPVMVVTFTVANTAVLGLEVHALFVAST